MFTQSTVRIALLSLTLLCATDLPASSYSVKADLNVEVPLRESSDIKICATISTDAKGLSPASWNVEFEVLNLSTKRIVAHSKGSLRESANNFALCWNAPRNQFSAGIQYRARAEIRDWGPLSLEHDFSVPFGWRRVSTQLEFAYQDTASTGDLEKAKRFERGFNRELKSYKSINTSLAYAASRSFQRSALVGEWINAVEFNLNRKVVGDNATADPNFLRFYTGLVLAEWRNVRPFATFGYQTDVRRNRERFNPIRTVSVAEVGNPTNIFDAQQKDTSIRAEVVFPRTHLMSADLGILFGNKETYGIRLFASSTWDHSSVTALNFGPSSIPIQETVLRGIQDFVNSLHTTDPSVLAANPRVTFDTERKFKPSIGLHARVERQMGPMNLESSALVSYHFPRRRDNSFTPQFFTDFSSKAMFKVNAWLEVGPEVKLYHFTGRRALSADGLTVLPRNQVTYWVLGPIVRFKLPNTQKPTVRDKVVYQFR